MNQESLLVWLVLGSLMIQKQLGFSDRELVEEITENPLARTIPWQTKERCRNRQKTEYKDNADWIAVERVFALAKQKCGLGLITSRLDETTRCSIALTTTWKV